METNYVYMKTRTEFGKQCIFDYYDRVDEDIQPNAALMNDYIIKRPCNVAVQKSKSLAVHEVQTDNVIQKNSGMFHSEGGWPKEINSRDEEATARFRRRVEKEDDWAGKLKVLFEPMEHCIRQNNAINIYQHYFDEMVPTKLIRPVGLRTVNIYADPNRPVRPINGISWSSDSGRKMAVSYCSMKFQNATELSSYSYIWEIENPNNPCTALKTFSPLATTEFCPNDPSILASGLLSGQICTWDIRTGHKPIQMSHRQFSHRHPVCSIKWIHATKSMEAFSASSDGRLMWWDMRKLQKPTEVLLLNSDTRNHFKEETTIGVSSLDFEPTMGTKFLLGTENGIVISGSRRGRTAREKLSLRFYCHIGPVLSVDRNSHNPKYFLTIGDWTARIWAEDTRESCLTSTRYYKKFLSGGCWSTSRCSVFYTIDRTGHLDAWDLLAGTREPVVTLQLCDNRLTTISPHKNGILTAVGTFAGNVHLVEASEALVTTNKNDKLDFVAYADRCSRYAKALDTRLREIRLARRIIYKEELPERKLLQVKSGKDRVAGKAKSEDERRVEERKLDEAIKLKEDGKKLEDLELARAEMEYYKIISEEMKRYNAERLDSHDLNQPAILEERLDEKTAVKSRGKKNKRGKKDRGGKEERKNKGKVTILKMSESTNVESQEERERKSKTEENEETEKTGKGTLVSGKGEIRDSKILEKLLEIGEYFEPMSNELRKPFARPCDNAICEAKVCWKGAIREERDGSYEETKMKEWKRKIEKAKQVEAITNNAGPTIKGSIKPSIESRRTRPAEKSRAISASEPRKFSTVGQERPGTLKKKLVVSSNVLSKDVALARRITKETKVKASETRSKVSTRYEEIGRKILVEGTKQSTNAKAIRAAPAGFKSKSISIDRLIDRVAEEKRSSLRRGERRPLKFLEEIYRPREAIVSSAKNATSIVMASVSKSNDERTSKIYKENVAAVRGRIYPRISDYSHRRLEQLSSTVDRSTTKEKEREGKETSKTMRLSLLLKDSER